MRYDGSPGMMLDLVPASPDGVDVEWLHPYTDAQPYVYAKNNPVVFTDLSGLAPRRRKPKPAPPVPPPPLLCALQICCVSTRIRCKNGPEGVFGNTACHCFVRLTGDSMVVADFHGGWGLPAAYCCGDVVLTCDRTLLQGQINALPGATADDCITLALGNCSTLKECLDQQINLCNNRNPPRCYGYCTSPNSNTVAYELLAACMTRRPPTPGDFAPPACNTQPPAPGFGPFKD